MPEEKPEPVTIRWTLHKACAEFAINRRTLERRLSESETVSGPDGCYSTLQIMTALTGDIRAERLRKVREEADHIALKNAEARRELLPAKDLYRVLESTFTVIRQEIIGSQLPEDTRNSILSHLVECEVPG